MSSARSIAILVTGEPVPDVRARSGSFAAMIARTIGDAWPHGFMSFDVREAEGRDALARLPAPPAALVITGSAANVPTREPWILACEALLRPLVARGVPTLGLCFGHQLLAQALGGEVATNPAGREIGTTAIELVAPDPLFAGLPARFLAQVSHVDTVVRPPEGAVVLARSARDRHQALCFGPRCYGVQFHPEFDRQVILGYLEARREIIVAEGQSPDALIAAAEETPQAAELLVRFARQLLPG